MVAESHHKAVRDIAVDRLMSSATADRYTTKTSASVL